MRIATENEVCWTRSGETKGQEEDEGDNGGWHTPVEPLQGGGGDRRARLLGFARRFAYRFSRRNSVVWREARQHTISLNFAVGGIRDISPVATA